MAQAETPTRPMPREAFASRLWQMASGLLDRPMAAIQRLIGGSRMAWIFLGPNIIFFGLFVFLPIGINIALSVTGGTKLFVSERPYIGAAHYSALLDCGSYLDPGSCREDHFWKGVSNTLKFTLFQMVAMVGTALVTALVLNRKIRGRGFFRAVYFFPYCFHRWCSADLEMDSPARRPSQCSDHRSRRTENPVFRRSRLGDVLGGFRLGLAHMGFYTLILLAGLQAIPSDLYEAAEMDGTPPMRVLTRITLPLLWPNLLVVLVLVLIKAVQTFDEVFVLTGGGPGTATVMVVQYIYETAFANQVQNFGRAAAASMLLGGLLFALTMVQLWFARRKSA